MRLVSVTTAVLRVWSICCPLQQELSNQPRQTLITNKSIWNSLLRERGPQQPVHWLLSTDEGWMEVVNAKADGAASRNMEA
jgi:hypothetical protein